MTESQPASAVIWAFLLQHGEFDKAAAQLQIEIAHPDERPEARWAPPHMFLAMALLHVPKDADGNFTVENMVPVLSSSAHIDDAITEFGKALNADPDFYGAHKALAIIYRYQGNAAMAEFRQIKPRIILQKQDGL